jgi:RNA polymerase sigma factor (sigma-70 family)
MIRGEVKARRRTYLDAAELCEAHAGVVYRFARMVSVSDSDAEDLAHDALVKAIRAYERFDPQRGDAPRWLWRIVVNTARDRNRIATRRHLAWERLRDWTRAEAVVPVEDVAVARLEDAELIAAVRRLPARSRVVIALRYGADLDFETVGSELGISAAGARMAHGRALNQLRLEFRKGDIHDQPA